MLAGRCVFGRDDLIGAGGFQKLKCSHDASAVSGLWLKDRGLRLTVCCFAFVKGRSSDESSEFGLCNEIELKSLILAQIERWRHALHMQVERQRGGNPGGERRTGE